VSGLFCKRKRADTLAAAGACSNSVRPAPPLGGCVAAVVRRVVTSKGLYKDLRSRASLYNP